MMRRTLAAAIVATSLTPVSVTGLVGPAAAMTVFDPWNYAENITQAARALEQINNQIQALQNQAQMLQNMAKHLERLDVSALGEITDTLQRIDRLMTEAEQVTFDVDEIESRLKQLFPDRYDTAVTTDQHVAEARNRWQSSMDAYRRTMRLQAQVAENIEADSATLADLVTASQGAAGSLAAQQAANELSALAIKQQLQIQNLMAAQFRAEALNGAREAQAEEAAHAATKRFLGNGKAYTPR